jgi:hypothetical protein
MRTGQQEIEPPSINCADVFFSFFLFSFSSLSLRFSFSFSLLDDAGSIVLYGRWERREAKKSGFQFRRRENGEEKASAERSLKIWA